MREFLKIITFLTGFVVAAIVFIAPSLNRLTVVERKSEVKIGNQIIIAEVVKSEKDRARGLSGRDSIGINEGMLFLFDKAGLYSFWMKDMKFPIDIVWINGDKIVGFEENVQPTPGARDSDLKIYYPPAPVNKVLELKAGRVELLRAGVGDTVKIRPLIKRSTNENSQ